MRIDVISPLHIGSGEILTSADFVVPENEVIVLDLERLMSFLPTEDIDEIVDILKRVPYPWEKILKRYRLNPRNFARYSAPLIGRKQKESMQIRAFIKSDGKPYIPGSSIKGAIRTAVMFKIVEENARLLNQAVRWLNSNIKSRQDVRRFLKRADDWLEAKVFGHEGRDRYEPKRDPFKALIIRDSEKISPRHLRIYSVR